MMDRYNDLLERMAQTCSDYELLKAIFYLSGKALQGRAQHDEIEALMADMNAFLIKNYSYMKGNK